MAETKRFPASGSAGFSESRSRLIDPAGEAPGAHKFLEQISLARFGQNWEKKPNEDITMARDEHNKAAEHHENAAKAHRSAADHHGKGDHAKGMEQANAAKQHSQTAHQHSDQAHGKSQQQK
jgi:hypothetical protein